MSAPEDFVALAARVLNFQCAFDIVIGLVVFWLAYQLGRLREKV